MARPDYPRYDATILMWWGCVWAVDGRVYTVFDRLNESIRMRREWEERLNEYIRMRREWEEWQRQVSKEF